MPTDQLSASDWLLWALLPDRKGKDILGHSSSDPALANCFRNRWILSCRWLFLSTDCSVRCWCQHLFKWILYEICPVLNLTDQAFSLKCSPQPANMSWCPGSWVCAVTFSTFVLQLFIWRMKIIPSWQEHWPLESSFYLHKYFLWYFSPFAYPS